MVLCFLVTAKMPMANTPTATGIPTPTAQRVVDSKPSSSAACVAVAVTIVAIAARMPVCLVVTVFVTSLHCFGSAGWFAGLFDTLTIESCKGGAPCADLLPQKGEENGPIPVGKTRELGPDLEEAALHQIERKAPFDVARRDVDHSCLGSNQSLARTDLEIEKVPFPQFRADLNTDAQRAQVERLAQRDRCRLTAAPLAGVGNQIDGADARRPSRSPMAGHWLLR